MSLHLVLGTRDDTARSPHFRQARNLTRVHHPSLDLRPDAAVPLDEAEVPRRLGGSHVDDHTVPRRLIGNLSHELLAAINEHGVRHAGPARPDKREGLPDGSRLRNAGGVAEDSDNMERGAGADDTEGVVANASRIEEAEDVHQDLEVEDVVPWHLDGSWMTYPRGIAA